LNKLRLLIPAIGLLILAFWLLFQKISPVVFHANTAHIFMLNTLKIWDEKGIDSYHAAPVQTWPEAKKLNHYYTRLKDKNGSNYYISHPPLAFIANFALLKFFGFPLNQSSLQWILIFIFLIEAVLLGWIIKQISQQKNLRYLHLTILAALAFYLLNPVNLYAHSQHNFSEIWGQFFLITTLAAWTLYLQSDRIFIVRLLLFLSAALLAATDWMGLTMMAALFIIYFKQFKKPHIRFGLIMVATAVIITSAAVFMQYVSIGGLHALYKALGIRYLERSGFFGSQYTDMGYDVLNSETWLMLIKQVHNILSGPGYIVVAMAIICFVFARKKCGPVDLTIQKVALLTALLFFIAVLSASSIHYIYTARFTPFIALAGAALFAKILEVFKKPGFVIGIFIFLMHLAAFWSTGIFHKSIPEPDTKQAQLNAAAVIIKQNKIDAIPLTSDFVESDIIYLSYKSERNLVWIK